MAYFMRSGKTFRVSSKESLDLHELLPAANYVIKVDHMGNLYLEMVDSFPIPGKLYGDTNKQTQRIISTFNSRPSQTGVMLTGEKGSGKSLLAKNVCIEAAKTGVPTIIINSPYTGDKFNAFIQSIDQPLIVLFDEFEKVYDRDAQEHILTLLDGVFPSKKLFILTCNDKFRVDRNMSNRPGRLYYFIEFGGLSVDFVREYCEDNLKNKAHIDTMCNYSMVFSKFNFDMLKAMVEEMNRYNETPEEVAAWLNTKPELAADQTFNVSLEVVNPVGEIVSVDELWSGNPLSERVSVDYAVEFINDENEKERDWCTVKFSLNDIVSVSSKTQTFEYKNERGRLLLTPSIPKGFNMFSAMV